MRKIFIMDLVIMIMRACIYLLLPLYLRNLLFPCLLMKMLLIIFLKIPHNVIEVMVVLMVLLLALKLVQSGVQHQSVQPRTPFCRGVGVGGGLNLQPNFQKGVLTGPQLLEGVAGKEGSASFRGRGVAIST